MARVEAGIETCDLRNVRHPLRHCFDNRDIVGLMERCERNQTPKLADHFRSDYRRSRKPRAAMDDSMSNACDLDSLIARTQPVPKFLQSFAAVIECGFRDFINKNSAHAVLGVNSLRCSAFYGAARLQPPFFSFWLAVDGEFKA